jgi:hypothetical protein
MSRRDISAAAPAQARPLTVDKGGWHRSCYLFRGKTRTSAFRRRCPMMQTSLLSAAMVVAAGMAIGMLQSGCGDSPSPPTTQGGLSQQGGPCGGNIANPPQCADGLVCVYDSVPDVGGTCQPSGGCVDNVDCVIGKHWDSQACTCVDDGADGGTGPDAVCVDNVDCRIGTHWDTTACTCVEDADGGSDGGSNISQEGGACGGNIANPKQCAPGLHCQTGSIPDVGGTCVAN